MTKDIHTILFEVISRYVGGSALEKGSAQMKNYAKRLDKSAQKTRDLELATLRLQIKQGGLNHAQAKGVINETKRGIVAERAQKKRDVAHRKRVRNLAAQKRDIKKLDNTAQGYGLTTRNFKSALERENLVMEKNGDIIDANTKKTLNHEQVQKRVTRGSAHFRMELLGVMFFGMGVARVFGMLTQGGLEASGAMEVWGTMAMLVGLPAATKLTEKLMDLLRGYSILDDETKEFISWSAFAGQGLGILTMAFGATALGVLSLAQLFPAFGVLLKSKGIMGIMGMIGERWMLVFRSLPGKIMGGLLLVKMAIGGIIEVCSNVGKNAMKVGRGVINFVSAVVLISLVATGAISMGWAVLIGALIWGAGKLLIAWKPFANLLAWIGKLMQGIGGATRAIFTKDVSIGEGWSSGWNTPSGVGPLEEMASGGIVSSPTLAMIGESGPEAVIPLSGSGGFGGAVSTTVNINNPVISNSMDVGNIGNQVNEILMKQLRAAGIR